jgi:hypothetical protein
MAKRPHSVTIISCVMIAAGVVGLVYHSREFKIQHPLQDGVLWISLVRLLAIVCGVFMLRRSNWARWLTLAWIAFHVVLSFFHSWQEVVMHGLLLAAFAYFLFRPQANEYFHASKSEAT